MELNATSIQEAAKKIIFPNRAFINGNYTPAKSGQTFDCISPIDGKKLTEVASCDQMDVDEAVSAARQSFEQGVWAKQSPADRKATLFRLADLMERHATELALLETLDMGKPIADSLNDDIPGAIDRIRWVAESIDKVYGDIAPTSDQFLGMITREPCGVVAAITPWNFPLYLASTKIAPALAAGNSVIIKPAEQSPLTTIRIAELATEAGIPAGVFNVLPGMGETAGKALGLHHDVDVLSFTGSTEIGKLCLQYSAQSNMKRILLECGGKSPNIIMADAPDLQEAAIISAAKVFRNQGQICCAPTRLLVEKSIHEKVLAQIVTIGKNLQPNNPLDPDTKLGALVDQQQMQRVLGYIDAGKSSAAKLVCGGSQTRTNSGGFYIEPTIFDHVKNEMKIAREEIFGPVLSVISFDGMEEAIKIANDTTYGLAASLWTRDINKAHKMARAIRAGAVSINCVDTGDHTVTFGGYKQSGIGREGSLQEFNNYTELKTTWIKID